MWCYYSAQHGLSVRTTRPIQSELSVVHKVVQALGLCQGRRVHARAQPELRHQVSAQVRAQAPQDVPEAGRDVAQRTGACARAPSCPAARPCELLRPSRHACVSGQHLARCAQIRLLDASDDHALASALAHQLVPNGKPKDDRALRVSVAEAIRAHLKKAGVDMDVEARAWVHEYTEYSLGLREVGAHALTFNLRRACVPCACAAGSRVRACACSAMLTYRGMSSMHARPRAHLRTPPARHSLRH